MSTLKVNTIQHNTSGFNNVVQFTDGAGTQNGTFCRAWVNFNGTGVVAIRAQFNVSSIIDNGTGDYTVNFSNAMTNANYCIITAIDEISTAYNATTSLFAEGIKTGSTTTTSFRVTVGNVNPGSYRTSTDPNYLGASIFS